jgi:hypothetical protein
LTSVTIGSGVTTIGNYAFDDRLFSYHLRYNLRAGTYEQRNNQWYYNGTSLSSPATLRLGRNAWLVSIDGESPASFIGTGLTKETPASITASINKNLHYSYFVWPRNFPARITEFFQGSFYLTPGTHTIEVIYIAHSLGGGISYTTDSMIWEQRYLFEGYTYEVTATPTADGKQISFAIRRQ